MMVLKSISMAGHTVKIRLKDLSETDFWGYW